MECKRCQSTRHTAASINSRMANQTVRKRVCRDCGNIWFTAEIIVPSFAVGWSPIGKGGSKPVLRVPMDVTLDYIEADDKDGRCRANARVRRAFADPTVADPIVTDCDDGMV